MKVEELLAQSYYESHEAQFKELILSAYTKGYTEGYNNALKKSREIKNNLVVPYVDLGLPSGTLWADPRRIIPPGCKYTNYDIRPYCEVCELTLPTLEDFQELLNHCELSFCDDSPKTVYITAPNGQRIVIQTQNYQPKNSNYLHIRKGDVVPEGTNMFWLKSEVKDNEASAVVVDTNIKELYPSTHYVGYKLPYLSFASDFSPVRRRTPACQRLPSLL